MESEVGTPSPGHRPEPIGPEEGAQIPAEQPEAMGVEDAPLSAQQPEPIGTEGAPTVLQQPEPMGARDSSPTSAQRLQPTGSVSTAGIVFRSRSAPATLQIQTGHQPPLLQEDIERSSGSSSVWISNASDTTNNCSSASLHINHAVVQTDGRENENGAGQSVRSSGSLRRDTGRSMGSEPSLSTDGASRHEETDNPTGRSSSNVSAPSSRRDSSVTNTSSISLSFSASSSGSDPPKPDILGLRRSSALGSDERVMDDKGYFTPLMKLVEVYAGYLQLNEHQQSEEHILSLIKCYVDEATNFIVDMQIKAREVFENYDYDDESSGRESPSHLTEGEVQRAEFCASLESRLQTVRDYDKSASENTKEEAIAEMILQEYNNEMRMAESDIKPDAASGDVSHDMEVEEGGVPTGGETYAESDLASAGVKEVPLNKIPAEELDSTVQTASGSHCGSDLSSGGVKEVPLKMISAEGSDSTVQSVSGSHIDSDLASGDTKEVPLKRFSADESDTPFQTASGSLKRERVQEEEASSVSIGRIKVQLRESRSSSSSNSDKDSVEHASSSHFDRNKAESESYRKFRKSQERALTSKVFSMTHDRVCAIRTVNYVMLRCLRMVIGIVSQALEANAVSHRTITETVALRSAGTSGDYIGILAEAAIASSQCAEKAVREIEEAVHLHKLVVDALITAERALFNIRSETCDGMSLFRHLNLSVQTIESQVLRACKTYMDRPSRASDSPDSNSSPAPPNTDGIHGPVMDMAFENDDDGPSDVFQALVWACLSSINAMETIVNGLKDFSTAKPKKPPSPDME